MPLKTVRPTTHEPQNKPQAPSFAAKPGLLDGHGSLGRVKRETFGGASGSSWSGYDSWWWPELMSRDPTNPRVVDPWLRALTGFWWYIEGASYPKPK